jgi:hypothetical protein
MKRLMAFGRSTLSLRNASLGNLVLFALLTDLMRCESTLHTPPLTAACATFCEEVCGIPQLIRVVLGRRDVMIRFLPAGDYSQRGPSPVEFPFPSWTLRAVLKNGVVLRGQTMISYGTTNLTDNLTDSHAVNKTVKPSPLTSDVMSLHCDPSASACGGVFEANPIVQRLLLTNRNANILLCRGSLMTSAVASALPFAELLRAFFIVLMLNGSMDRETSLIASAFDYTKVVERLLGCRIAECWIPRGCWVPSMAPSAAPIVVTFPSVTTQLGGDRVHYDDVHVAQYVLSKRNLSRASL